MLNPRSSTPPDPESFEKQTKDLEKLTTNFYAALNDLLPAAIRASKRGKHGLLRLISRKLPRPKLPEPEDPDADLKADDEAAAIAENVRLVFERPLEIPTPPTIKGEEKKKNRRRRPSRSRRRQPRRRRLNHNSAAEHRDRSTKKHGQDKQTSHAHSTTASRKAVELVK